MPDVLALTSPQRRGPACRSRAAPRSAPAAGPAFARWCRCTRVAPAVICRRGGEAATSSPGGGRGSHAREGRGGQNTGVRGTRGRRSAAHWGPVEVRSMSSPRSGWSLQDAVRLVEQGYRLEHVEQVTGFAAAHVRGQLRPRSVSRPDTRVGVIRGKVVRLAYTGKRVIASW